MKIEDDWGEEEKYALSARLFLNSLKNNEMNDSHQKQQERLYAMLKAAFNSGRLSVQSKNNEIKNTKEVITKIKKIFDDDKDSEYDGYKITTNKQEIVFGISNDRKCCEEFGCLISEDNHADFIGSVIFNIKIVDEKLYTYEVNPDIGIGPDLKDIEYGGTVFVNIETSKGTLQLVAYNSHNGYYGHNVIIKANQLKIEI